MKKDKPIIDTLTRRQIQDLLKALADSKTFLANGIGSGLKTGWALSRKGLVELADIQLDNWTRWKITQKGIELAGQLNSRNSTNL